MSDKVVELRPVLAKMESSITADQLWELRRSFLAISDQAIRITLLDLVKSVALSQENNSLDPEIERCDR